MLGAKRVRSSASHDELEALAKGTKLPRHSGKAQVQDNPFSRRLRSVGIPVKVPEAARLVPACQSQPITAPCEAQSITKPLEQPIYELDAPFSPARFNSLLNIIQYSPGIFGAGSGMLAGRARVIFYTAALSARDAALGGIREILAKLEIPVDAEGCKVFLPGCGNCAEAPLLRHYLGAKTQIIAADPLIGLDEDQAIQVNKLIKGHLRSDDVFSKAKAQEISLPEDLAFVLIRHPHPDQIEDWRAIINNCLGTQCKRFVITFTSAAERAVFEPVLSALVGSNAVIMFGETEGGLKIDMPVGRPAMGPDHCYLVLTRSIASRAS